MISFKTNTKCKIEYNNNFKKQLNQLKKVIKQNKDINELLEVITRLANQEKLEKYKNHKLINNKIYQDCNECYINPDWVLVYKYIEDRLVILFFATGRHSELFNK